VSNFGSRRVALRLVELTARPNLGPLALHLAGASASDEGIESRAG
jgi:hypothetical protein